MYTQTHKHVRAFEAQSRDNNTLTRSGHFFPLHPNIRHPELLRPIVHHLITPSLQCVRLHQFDIDVYSRVVTGRIVYTFMIIGCHERPQIIYVCVYVCAGKQRVKCGVFVFVYTIPKRWALRISRAFRVNMCCKYLCGLGTFVCCVCESIINTHSILARLKSGGKRNTLLNVEAMRCRMYAGSSSI